MNYNNTKPKSFRRIKRGVGAVIGSVILAGILPINGNNNLNTAITIPTTMEDGSAAIVPGDINKMRPLNEQNNIGAVTKS